MEHMIDWSEFNSHLKKVIHTIQSCETLEHLEGSRRYSENMLRLHIFKAMESPKHSKKSYQEKIEWAQTIIKEELSKKKFLVKYAK